MANSNIKKEKIYTRDVNLKDELAKKNRKKFIWKVVLQALVIIVIAAVAFFLIFMISFVKKLLI